ncbi:MAG: hypothetical protein JF593_01405 [Novosphingobium sp.]|nr:hypothetical protein [Novosphingobium sp.]
MPLFSRPPMPASLLDRAILVSIAAMAAMNLVVLSQQLGGHLATVAAVHTTAQSA